MKITTTQYAKSLYEATVGISEQETDAVVANFLKLLQKSRKRKLAGKIITKFSEIYNQKNSIVEAEVVSREALSNELRNYVSNYISTKYQAKEVNLNNKIDLNIKGGIVIKVGDEIMDASVARQLEELKNGLAK